MKGLVKVAGGAVLAAAGALSVAMTATLAAEAQNDGPSPVCLNVTQIMNTRVEDSRTILYRMRDGKVWRNRLAYPCPDLATTIGGYTQKSHDDWICANTQTITVNQTGMVCRLGPFTRVN